MQFCCFVLRPTLLQQCRPISEFWLDFISISRRWCLAIGLYRLILSILQWGLGRGGAAPMHWLDGCIVRQAKILHKMHYFLHKILENFRPHTATRPPLCSKILDPPLIALTALWYNAVMCITVTCTAVWFTGLKSGSLAYQFLIGIGICRPIGQHLHRTGAARIYG